MLILLRLLEDKEEELGRPPTRARLSGITLKRLWKRERLTDIFMNEVQDWLITAGWALLDVGSTYAAVKVDTVENWPRLSSKRIQGELHKAGGDAHYFEQLEERLLATQTAEAEALEELDDLLEDDA
jgi:hypothetical protein